MGGVLIRVVVSGSARNCLGSLSSFLSSMKIEILLRSLTLFFLQEWSPYPTEISKLSNRQNQQ